MKTTKETIATLRREYAAKELLETKAHTNPITQFRTWFEEAVAAELHEPNAMHLSTASPSGQPSSRMVLLKDIGDTRFFFFTNYTSQKGREIETNPNVACLFFWAELERQVRIEGTAVRTDRTRSEDYFETRPRASQIGAWASDQSERIPHRDWLAERTEEFETRFAGAPVPCPPHWGGYAITPSRFEFWQGGRDRLHDRLVYEQDGDAWQITRLSP